MRAPMPLPPPSVLRGGKVLQRRPPPGQPRAFSIIVNGVLANGRAIFAPLRHSGVTAEEAVALLRAVRLPPKPEEAEG